MSSGQSSASIGESIGKCIRCFEAQDVETPEELLGGDVVIKGTVLLSKKYLIDFADLSSNFVDNALDLMGRKVTFQLVSVDLDPQTNAPKVSTKYHIRHWALTDDIKPGDSVFAVDNYMYVVTFRVPHDFGEIGAFFIRNNHRNEFYLLSLTLENPDKSTIEFPCNSWVYNTSYYKNDRVFFSNKMYLPDATPAGLKALRSRELQELQGDGTGMRKEGERIYDYDVYNDLQLESARRPVLGGSTQFPYPRRCRTGRPKATYDPNSEATLSEAGVSAIYLPRDERFTRVKNSGFLASAIKSIAHFIVPAMTSYFDTTPNEFGSFDEIKSIYNIGINLKGHLTGSDIKSKSKTPADNPFILLDTIFDADGSDKSIMHFPSPEIIASDDKAWLLDEEFGRQTLAGMNPLAIQLMTEFPPTSSLDPAVYGPASALQKKHILPNIEGMTIPEALSKKRLFIVDHHDAYMVYLEKINSLDLGKCYAPRVILFFTSKGQMMPIAIELSLPPPPGQTSAVRRVFTAPNGSGAMGGQKDYLWELAKLHAASVDFGMHELSSHWLRTHAVMEPIVIATNRQLSAMHPINALLYPVCKNTMNINSAARGSLINATGILENIVTPGMYAMEMTSVLYGTSWRFDRQGLPQDLIARGMAVPDSTQPGGVKLVVDDYPFAKDGLDFWEAVYSWVSKSVNLAYASDEAVQQDVELQSWWNEIVNVGHADLKDAPWWPKADSRSSLVDILTTISWIAGPHHAAVNFGQYAYAAFTPNRPPITRRLIPEMNSVQYFELIADPERFMLSSAISETRAVIAMALFELLSTHSTDEEYQGQRLFSNWTCDPLLQSAFSEFSAAMKALEEKINARNTDPSLSNRIGKAQVPYTLLFPSSTSGLTGRGVPYSVSI
ncbi:protein MpLOX12 [Marchantia polymorpha subsp. ruderalis]|uniref:Lipoxygenase n=2 Tax=Marchantia polymorpha TaxID=3197 RepID=A0A176VGX1_MARPO|nr:hypothetical protein AXG93_1847s1470 [Marchantia polymorpha subsp. ruderalis]PTQ36347.1 hypothetical protein MARPO_0064s0034 [Marchantia polymorpha]BBN18325.1 hypothetical protein Mp_8g01650 [Marchantia polymorpha subsp. ruderalis]|eukprot:PTQ36347.1 hypothetical protein MARPO_0064s0034 [Marchantia polymorpha]